MHVDVLGHLVYTEEKSVVKDSQHYLAYYCPLCIYLLNLRAHSQFRLIIFSYFVRNNSYLLAENTLSLKKIISVRLFTRISNKLRALIKGIKVSCFFLIHYGCQSQVLTNSYWIWEALIKNNSNVFERMC